MSLEVEITPSLPCHGCDFCAVASALDHFEPQILSLILRRGKTSGERPFGSGVSLVSTLLVRLRKALIAAECALHGSASLAKGG